MNTKGTNRSVRKTKAKLRDGLTNLLQEKPIRDITVREISDLVDINRGTFYLHYRDIFDMVEQIETELMSEFSSIMECHIKDERGEPLSFLNDIFHFLGDNADLCSALIGDNGDIGFINKLKDMVKNNCLHMWLKFYRKQENFNYYFEFLSTGCIGLFELWLKSNMNKSPDEMAKLTNEFVLHGMEVLR